MSGPQLSVPQLTAPQLIAVVSGKGGVGKTMLSVAIASEMARGCRTLLIDLDFFNRGLTGLFASMVARSPSQRIDPPAGLISTVDRDDWVIAHVEENLFVLSYGDVDRASSGDLETMDVHDVARHLDSFIARACATAGCEVAILDCHGGPDSTSFAACLLARHTILVSEPDKITLYGTLNFLRTLEGLIPDRRADIRLVLNKVIPAFKSRFLFRFYRRFLAQEFPGRELLAIYPIEAHLTKAFERTPFLTTVYPTSQLAAKTRMLLRSLLLDEAPQLLPAAIRKRWRIGRLLDRYYMGRWPALFDPDAICRLVAVLTIVMFVLPLMARNANRTLHISTLAMLASVPDIKIGTNTLAQLSAGLAAVWFLVVIVLRWCRDLDIFTTYSFRTRSVVGASLGAVPLFGLSVLWGLTAVWPLWLVWKAAGTHAASYIVGQMLVVGIILLPTVMCVWWYVRRGFRSMWYDGRFIEGGFRLAFCASVTVVAVLLIGFLT